MKLNRKRLCASDVHFRPFTFAVFADTHLHEEQGIERLEIFTSEVNAQSDVAFALFLGDLGWEGPIGELRALLDRLNVPCFMVMGNQDLNRREEFETAFGPSYFHFDFAACRFIGLWNTVLPGDPDDHRGYMDDAQIAWAERVLCESRRGDADFNHVFLFAHVPLCPSDEAANSMTMVPELAARWRVWCADFQVTACFFGHLHADEDFVVDRTRMLVTPSLNWNFPVDGEPPVAPDDFRHPWGGYRLIHVGADVIEASWHPLA